MSLILKLWIASLCFLLARAGYEEMDIEEWEYKFITSVKHQYGSYHENDALIIKSKLYYWTEEDKVNLCYNLNKEMLDPAPDQLFLFKEGQQPSVIEKLFKIQTSSLFKPLKDIFWFIECVRCPIKGNTFYVIESSRKNCYLTLSNNIFQNKTIVNIVDEICDVNVLNSAV